MCLIETLDKTDDSVNFEVFCVLTWNYRKIEMRSSDLFDQSATLPDARVNHEETPRVAGYRLHAAP